MQVKGIYSIRSRSAAWVMLALFMFFSLSAPMLGMEIVEKQLVKQAVIDIPQSLAVNKNFQPADGKYDFGQQRITSIFSLECGGLLTAHIARVSEDLQRQLSTISFPLFTIATYLFDCVFRI